MELWVTFCRIRNINYNLFFKEKATTRETSKQYLILTCLFSNDIMQFSWQELHCLHYIKSLPGGTRINGTNQVKTRNNTKNVTQYLLKLNYIVG